MTNTDIAAYVTGHPWLIIIGVWEAVWKLIALWQAARRNHLTMFIIMAILNTAGILPIVYLLWLHFKNKKQQAQ
ncbi:MAG: hypothetical protein KGH93_00655 [Patescibacteria group bacterium]|nr:hypothetical protein [Patescibacteria group bacterium]MDE1945697.1 hypothetical protein [Patescibacteria group bacterium]